MSGVGKRLLPRRPALGNPTRLAGSVLTGGLVLGVCADAARQTGVPPALMLGIFLAGALVVTGVVARSSIGLAIGFVGVAFAWSMAQDHETASGAVMVGAVLSAAAISISWLLAPRSCAGFTGTAMRLGRLAGSHAAWIGVGLLILQLVEGDPRHPFVAIGGVLAVLGVLGLMFVVADMNDF